MLHFLYTQAKAAAAGLLLSLFLCVACSDEGGNHGPEIPEVQYADVSIYLGTADAARPTTTKANDGTNNNNIQGDADDVEYERHIEDWWVVIVDAQDRIYRVLSNTKSNTWTEETGSDDNEHKVNVSLVVGDTYRFYAFANLKSLTNGETLAATINDLESGTSLFADFRKQAVSLLELNQYHSGTDGKAIPMSSYGEKLTVSANMNENAVTLLLIRLLGKVSIEITNATGVDLTVNSVTMGKFRTTGNIFLMPYDAINSDPGKPNLLVQKDEETSLLNPKFPTTTESVGADHTYTPAEGDNLKTISKDAPDEGKPSWTHTFYINETAQENQVGNTSDMTVALDITGEGVERDKEPKNTQFFFIRRNDWIKVPLLISKAEVTITMEQMHMPIGGIPAEVKFNPGVEIPTRTFITDHAGAIKISYSLDRLNNDDQNWSLRYYTDDKVTSSDMFCYAGVVTDSNKNNLLLEPDAANKDAMNWWLNTRPTKPVDDKYIYKLTQDTGSKTKGSFTINVQELAYQAEATIRLNLVATKTADGQTQTIVLPYTLIIKNDKQPKEGA